MKLSGKLNNTLVGQPSQIIDDGSGGSFKKYLTDQIIAVKELRKDIDEQIQKVKELPFSRERSLSITRLQEAVMWLGMDLKRINDENPSLNMPTPYPSSKDPSTGSKIEPTADDLKL